MLQKVQEHIWSSIYVIKPKLKALNFIKLKIHKFKNSFQNDPIQLFFPRQRKSSVPSSHAWNIEMYFCLRTLTGYYFTLIEHCPRACYDFFFWVIRRIFLRMILPVNLKSLTVYCTWCVSSWISSSTYSVFSYLCFHSCLWVVSTSN